MQEKFDNTQLLLDLINGNEFAFAQVYKQYHQAILANILRLITNQQEAEDILQEVFIALWNNKHKLSVNHSIAGWLFTASYYKSIAILKKGIRQNQTSFNPELHDILAVAEVENTFEKDYTNRLDKLNAAIDLLPPQKKLAFKLCRLEGKTYDEIATALNISVESAKDYVKSASKLLKRQIVLQQEGSQIMGICVLVLFL